MQFGLGCSSAQRCRGKVRFLISYTLGICLALSCKRWPQTGFSGLELRLHCNAWCQVTDKMVSTFNLSLAAARPLMVMMKRRRGQADSRPARGPDFNPVRASSIKQVKINPLYLIESWTQRLNVAHAHCLFWRLRQRSGISSIGPPHGRFTLSRCCVQAACVLKFESCFHSPVDFPLLWRASHVIGLIAWSLGGPLFHCNPGLPTMGQLRLEDRRGDRRFEVPQHKITVSVNFNV